MGINFQKRDCHRMMQIIWGDTPKGKRKGYIWLHKKLGYNIHFTTVSQRDINEAQRVLIQKMIETGHDYLDDKKVTISPLKRIKEKKPYHQRNKATNLKELQRNHKTTIIRKSWWQKLLDKLTNL